jgi:hypothetical protein
MVTMILWTPKRNSVSLHSGHFRHFRSLFNHLTEALKRTWHSPVYTFFKLDNVSVRYHKDRLYHFFPCAARRCKTTAGGVRRFQDSKDRASTANLRSHAVRCFGEEAVQNGTKGKDIDGSSRSIFSMFARQGQKPVHYSHRSHTNTEVRYETFLLF